MLRSSCNFARRMATSMGMGNRTERLDDRVLDRERPAGRSSPALETAVTEGLDATAGSNYCIGPIVFDSLLSGSARGRVPSRENR